MVTFFLEISSPDWLLRIGANIPQRVAAAALPLPTVVILSPGLLKVHTACSFSHCRGLFVDRVGGQRKHASNDSNCHHFVFVVLLASSCSWTGKSQANRRHAELQLQFVFVCFCVVI